MARRRHLLVLFSHDVLHRLGPISTYWPHAHGAAGVDVFFAISGILICTLLLGEERQTGTISLQGFYIRRAFRILPAPFVYVAVVAILSALHVLTSVHKSELVSSPLFCRNHCCPVKSRTESIGCWDRVSQCRSRMREVPAKWAFSRIA